MKNTLRVINSVRYKLNDEFRLRFHRRYVRYQGNKFDLSHPRSIRPLKLALLRGTYEGREIELIKRHVNRGDKVLELGSCAGVTSLLIADIVGVENHLVFEPDSRNYEFSLYHFKLNSKNVRIKKSLLLSGNDIPESFEFYSGDNPSASSVLLQDHPSRREIVGTDQFERVIAFENSKVLVLDIGRRGI
ncbi:hypothetical protein [Salinisphaera sp.]|uniref:hypothetical protein n=1 Tax=Salinisphaera sp. TaxID=1914330 RepID=UPI0025ECE8AF|nr:hypothetical protein [Salinisphaera sp.]